MAELLITLADGRTTRHVLGKAPEVIGRDADCDIPIDDPSTSRNHARFLATPRGFMVEDLGSKNGTLVNDLPCRSQLLRDGDRVLIGSTLAVFCDSDSGTAPSVVIAEDTETGHATHYASRDRRLLLSQQRLEMIYELSERLTTLQNPGQLLEDALSICFETLHFERGAIGLRRSGQQKLDWPVVRNLGNADGELTISRTLLGRALDHGERAVFIEDEAAGADPTVSIVQQGIRSAMCVPLLHKEQTLGVIYGDRVSTSARYTQEDSDFLAAIARQISIGLINWRLVEQHHEMARLERDLDLARTIQTGLFPAALPNREGLQIAALNHPGQRVSGDYYDVVETSDGRVWCLVADVTGEGVAAALLMANLQAAVRLTIGWLDQQSGSPAGPQESADDPGALLARWNRLICCNTDASKFITCLLILVDPRSHRLRFATAGHHPPVIRRGHRSAPEELTVSENTFPLGVVEQAQFPTVDVDLGREQCVFLCYTDGVTEAMSAQDTLFGRERLLKAIAASPDMDPNALVSHVRQAVADHARGARQSDDITLLAGRVG